MAIYWTLTPNYSEGDVMINRQFSSSPYSYIEKLYIMRVRFNDRAEGHDLKSQIWLFFSPFLFPPKKRVKKKRRMNSKNRDFNSCLPARSPLLFCMNTLQTLVELMFLQFDWLKYFQSNQQQRVVRHTNQFTVETSDKWSIHRHTDILQLEKIRKGNFQLCFS